MEKFEEAVCSFIYKMGYLNNPDVLGIVLYGSYTTGYSHSKSDIDLHIIMTNDKPDIIRGAVNLLGFKIEYFEKPINDLFLSAENDFWSQNNALLPIIGCGRILYEKNNAITDLKKYILAIFSKPLPILEENSAKELAVIIENRISYLEKMFYNNSPEFMHNCHLVIEKIRKFYSRFSGCPDIPVSKTFRIYTDKAYRESFSKGKIPDKTFILLYFAAVKCQNKKKMLSYVKILYKYSVRDLNLDPSNYRIKILSRNDPRNRVHE